MDLGQDTALFILAFSEITKRETKPFSPKLKKNLLIIIVSQEKNLDLSRGDGTGRYNREVISLSSAVAVQRSFLFQPVRDSFRTVQLFSECLLGYCRSQSQAQSKDTGRKT